MSANDSSGPVNNSSETSGIQLMAQDYNDLPDDEKQRRHDEQMAQHFVNITADGVQNHLSKFHAMLDSMSAQIRDCQQLSNALYASMSNEGQGAVVDLPSPGTMHMDNKLLKDYFKDLNFNKDPYVPGRLIHLIGHEHQHMLTLWKVHKEHYIKAFVDMLVITVNESGTSEGINYVLKVYAEQCANTIVQNFEKRFKP